MGPRTGMDVLEKRNISTIGIQTPNCPARSLFAVSNRLSRLLRVRRINKNERN
jgi:hypothetical protein